MTLLLAHALAAAVGCAAVAPPCPATTTTTGTVALVRLDHAPDTTEERALPLMTWTERNVGVRPLAAHLVRVDLACPRLTLVALPAPDPDGDGPAEAELTDPVRLAAVPGVVAAINANGFAKLPGPDGREPSGEWRAGMPVDVVGLALTAGTARSVPDARHAGGELCFWTDATNGVHIAKYPGSPAGMREGWSAWWIDLVAGGRVLPKPGGDRHPRTAIGLDAGGRWLLVAVIDGRQPGYSVGMTAEELAIFMAQHGCDRAINLDGGGSSVLLAADASGKLAPLNRPSDGHPRPLPWMLGVLAR